MTGIIDIIHRTIICVSFEKKVSSTSSYFPKKAIHNINNVDKI